MEKKLVQIMYNGINSINNNNDDIIKKKKKKKKKKKRNP